MPENYWYKDWAIRECSNKLLRKFIPKSYPMDLLKQDMVDDWLNKINTIPRKKYSWLSAQELFDSLIE